MLWITVEVNIFIMSFILRVACVLQLILPKWYGFCYVVKYFVYDFLAPVHNIRRIMAFTKSHILQMIKTILTFNFRKQFYIADTLDTFEWLWWYALFLYKCLYLVRLFNNITWVFRLKFLIYSNLRVWWKYLGQCLFYVQFLFLLFVITDLYAELSEVSSIC